MNNSMPQHEIYTNQFQNSINVLFPTPVTYIFVPVTQSIQGKPSYQENFANLKFQNFKEVRQIAVQTQSFFFQQSQPKQNQFQNSNEKQWPNKEFPLPNKQKLIELFENIPSKRKEIRKFVSELCNKKTKTLNNFYISIGEKIISFKKTKEQIIKFLVRRAWKKQNNGADEARQKYYSEYKSMNSQYLSNIFSQPLFVKAYKEMLKNFDSDFDSYNMERFNRFYDYLLNCYVKNSLTKFKTSKECKSKLPYPQSWRFQIKSIAMNLYQNYCGGSELGETGHLEQRNQQKHPQIAKKLKKYKVGK